MIETFTDLVREDETIQRIISPSLASFMFENNKYTITNLENEWTENLKKNIKLYKKHGSAFALRGFGINKAVIGVGAGPSFHLNKHILYSIYRDNCSFALSRQPFVIVATNKSFKMLLDIGVYPHFIVLVDAADHLYDQLCTDIPEIAKRSILITGLHTSPRILKQWDKNGGKILFYLIGGDREKNIFRRKTKENPEIHHVQQGGNVLNTIWIIAHKILGSSVYMTVGNDLSFPYSKDKDTREKSFYADNDFSCNKRNETAVNLGWMGFKFNKSVLHGVPNTVCLEPRSTTYQLWVYKTFMEVQVALWAKQIPFHFYNCSENGILGVLNKPGDKEDKNNWFLMDELYPKRWHTRTLEDAANEFLKVKKWQINQEILTGASIAAV